ncbi:MAG: phenylalanine--tRNA ligase subunit alpha [Nanoarchaeota archaeon]|nr:phenylalanine--tRNA ligase subunit alpha [Nanoarchaeota archaeon]
MERKIEEVLESLNPDERAILPFLREGDLKKISLQSKIDELRTSRALQFLGNKGILKLDYEKKKLIDLDDNGIIYMKNSLPERRLLNLLSDKKTIGFENAKKESGLSENEFKVSLGVLKKKAMISLSRGKLILEAKKEEIIKKSLEEQFLESLPLKLEELKPEQKLAFQNLKSRKNIIILIEEKQVIVNLTELGKEIITKDLGKTKNMIEALTPEIIKSGSWKGKKFRRYDIKSPVPKIYGGKRHFVNQAMDYARKIWTELGFQEMSGNLTQTGFWNFDALFTAQDHPVREMQDTFYIKDIQAKLPDKKLVNAVKKSHEQGVDGSKGWQYKWNEEDAKKVLLRTHTTCLSAKTLSELKNKKGKFFAIGKVFRNETIDWSHGFEFNQTEGIVIDKDANFRHLLGYLKEFFNKMGFENIKFTPAYFPYTEPSVEIQWFHPERKVWLELGGAGIFRPELTIPLLGEHIPILAWGPGFDRTIMDYYNIKDLRELYENNIIKLRKKKFWLK